MKLHACTLIEWQKSHKCDYAFKTPNKVMCKHTIITCPVRLSEHRVDRDTLDNVCLDCMDFLKHPCVECKDCPVKRLKRA